MSKQLKSKMEVKPLQKVGRKCKFEVPMVPFNMRFTQEQLDKLFLLDGKGPDWVREQVEKISVEDLFKWLYTQKGTK